MAKEIDARYCPVCGERSRRIGVSKANASDGRVMRYRYCETCDMDYKTVEIHDHEWQQYRQLMKWARQFADNMNQLDRGDDP